MLPALTKYRRQTKLLYSDGTIQPKGTRFDSIRYDITQNITIGYDTIQSESASPYVRTASKQAAAHNTGAPSFCLSTLSPPQVPGYWLTGEATVGGGRPVFLEVQGYSAGLL